MYIFDVEDKKNEFKVTIEKFHILIPKNLEYSQEDIWIARQNDIIIIGITDFFQLLLGDIMFIEFLKGTEPIKKNQEIGSIESLKTVLDIISPVSGDITEINQDLVKKPEILNQEPYTNGWICKIKTSNFAVEEEDLINGENYVQLIKKKYEAEKERQARQRES